MIILVTGAKGFIGKNLISVLKNKKDYEILEFDIDKEIRLLEDYCQKADFVYHLAGANRPNEASEFVDTNVAFTVRLLNLLRKHENYCPIIYASTIQALLDNPYGRSKKAGEDALLEYGRETKAEVNIYRFPNVFGKWCRPNYNSVIATFCYNVAHELAITVNDPEVLLELVYIDDLVEELVRALNGEENRIGEFCEVAATHCISLGTLAEMIRSFYRARRELSIPDLTEPFTKKLYSTYLSYLPKEELCYELKMNIDCRGSFTPFIKQPDFGQLSVNITKPGIVKGNHWHCTKHEKFLVVSGRGIIRLRSLPSEETITYFVDGDKLQVVEIPAGYVHNIENLGDTDMVTLIWANECFLPDRPDTYSMEV